MYSKGFLGSTTRLTDASQATTDTRQYDAFGNLVASTGTNPTPFGFAGGWGYQSDADSGLQLLGHRYYDPSTGRFLTRDPARDGRNWYGYGENNPTGNLDPTGHSWWGWADDRWTDFSQWWSGTDVRGPHGEPVRIGGWPALFNQDDNAITVRGTVHLNGYDDYDEYINSNKWSAHECWHIVQETDYYGGNTGGFVIDSIVGYIIGLGHDNAPLEIDADNHAGYPYRDPLGYGLWPAIVSFSQAVL